MKPAMRIDFTQVLSAADQHDQAEAIRLSRERDMLLAYLTQTDWLVLRAAETGTPIPDDIRVKRTEARTAISELTARIPPASLLP